MFYSSTPNIINDNSSYLHSRHVFSGQYWDEFGMTAYLVPDNAKVLMLGLSLGGGVRPLLASSKNIELTCVDLDQQSMERCRSYYRKHFSGLRFATVIASAEDYLSQCKEKYDCIWLDIYENESYSPLLLGDTLYSRIRQSLTTSGVLLINAYGIPNQFAPLRRGGIQSLVASAVAKSFPFLSAIPYRRNVTFIAAGEPPEIYPCTAHAELAPLDQVAFQSLELKLRDLKPIQATLPVKAVTGEFSAIDQEMRGLWKEILSELANRNVHLSHAGELLDLIQSDARAIEILDSALIDKHTTLLSSFVILCAGESHLRPLHVDWIFDWSLCNAERLATDVPALYRDIWLPQLTSMILQTSGRYKKHYFKVLSLLKRASV